MTLAAEEHLSRNQTEFMYPETPEEYLFGMIRRQDRMRAEIETNEKEIESLAMKDQKALKDQNKEIEDIVAARKSRLRRYVSAKQHRAKLEGVAKKLEEARGNYTVRGYAHTHTPIAFLMRRLHQAAVVTLNATTTADVRAHVQAYTLLVGTTPVYAPGTRRPDAVTFPFRAARIDEA